MRAVIFVYGSLRRGESAHDHLGPGARFLDEAVLKGHVVYDLGRYPGIAPGDGVVHGERHEIDDDAWPALDAYEGPGYHRETLVVGGAPAEVYVLDEVPAHARALSSGRFPRGR